MSARISVVYQVYLNEDEDDVTRKKLENVEADRKELRVVTPGCGAALPGLGSGE
jgi:hypothetical protein